MPPAEPFATALAQINRAYAVAHAPQKPAKRFPDLSATTTFEVEVKLGGTYQKGYPERGPTYDCGGEPAEPDCVEDVEIEDIGGCQRVREPGAPFSAGKWVTTSLLDGVNVNSPDIQKLFANILQFIGDDEQQQVLLAEVGE